MGSVWSFRLLLAYELTGQLHGFDLKELKILVLFHRSHPCVTELAYVRKN